MARKATPSPPSHDARWYVFLPAIVFALTAWVSAGRMSVSDGGLSIYGNYDTLDLTYYAAISTQLGHTTVIPPASPFYAGHRIIYSYFPLALLSAIHKRERRADASCVSLVRLAAVHQRCRRDGLCVLPPAGFGTVCRDRIPAGLHRLGPLVPAGVVAPEDGGVGSAHLGERLHGAVCRVAVLQPVGADAQCGQPGPLWGESPR